MNIGDWIHTQENAVLGWFKEEDRAVINFFAPLMLQFKAAAIKLGKDDLAAGLKVLEGAALKAVTAAALAPPGTQVAAAELAFLTELASAGIAAIHNAEAGAIKAAVAILQSQTAVANTPAPVVVPVANTP